ncbi:FAD/NAD(P)-binding oxidoreductase [Cyanobium sp. FACHB-13342]|uniref:NAD(P)/FAD-dependent oxidoreductase n=1 Tax=Cyanobium sp. FACHB-13342 TaxID=2692793 RepID=UPI00168074DB|nr:FAD/NAD(P)-binding oxidoreductase [Cyanobium sp. FACHB-13342]MBD2422144.1 NAD(P)/FAD-dependent oxidoreductase [Cyanobium sp. FACHB-13342]
MAHHQILIAGGGAAGITVAAQLKRARPSLEVAILEPSGEHYYQPGWTLVGGGVFSLEDTRRAEGDLIPSGVTWIREAVAGFDPEHNSVTTASGQSFSYDVLIVATGLKLCWDRIDGLTEALGQGGVCSNYSKDFAPYTWEAIQAFKGGNAVFTCAPMPIKCPGAPQKIAYLADDVFKQKRLNAKVIYATATPGIFGIPTYAAPLREVVQRRGIDARYNHVLTAVRAAQKEAVFQVTEGETSRKEVIPYDLLHVTPPMAAPDAVATSPLANGAGFVEVDQFSLQHVRYPNVFSLGDVSGMPNSKTAAAVRGQAPVLVTNLLAHLDGQVGAAAYDGYSCCPLITGYGKAIMAEFNYKAEPVPSFPLDPTKERWSMWWIKRKLLPSLYWNRMLTGAQHERRFIPGVKGPGVKA